MLNRFGTQLRALRLERGLTQDQLAANTKISQTAISNWEAGNRIPSIEYLIILSKYFSVTMEFLCGLEKD